MKWLTILKLQTQYLYSLMNIITSYIHMHMHIAGSKFYKKKSSLS